MTADRLRGAGARAARHVPRLRSGRLAARAFALLMLASTPATSAGGAPDPAATADVLGLWVDHREADKQRVAVWIEDCGGLLCGRIYWMKKPLYGGKPKIDRHNPDAALRDRPLCGLQILTGFRRTKEGAWGSGHIYNPNDGRTFDSTMSLERDGALRIRGYVGLALFGRTVEWVRPKEELTRCG